MVLGFVHSAFVFGSESLTTNFDFSTDEVSPGINNFIIRFSNINL
jgi:hypothetical protein